MLLLFICLKKLQLRHISPPSYTRTAPALWNPLCCIAVLTEPDQQCSVILFCYSVLFADYYLFCFTVRKPVSVQTCLRTHLVDVSVLTLCYRRTDVDGYCEICSQLRRLVLALYCSACPVRDLLLKGRLPR